MTERIRENGQWVTKRELKSRDFNKRCLLFLKGNYLPANQKNKLKFKKITARVCKATAQTVHLRSDCY